MTFCARLTKLVLLSAIVALAIGAPAQTPNLPAISVSTLSFPQITPAINPIQSAGVSLVGNPGPQTFYYWLVPNYTVGNGTPQLAGSVTNGPLTLSASNYDQITFQIPVGVTSVDVLRTTTNVAPGGACNCAVATANTSGTVQDVSGSLSSYTVTTYNPSVLGFSIDNEVQSAGTSHLILRQNGTQITDLSAVGSIGTGNVNGPGSSTTNDIAIFSSATGKAIGDSGVSYLNLVTAASPFTTSGDLVQAAGNNKTTSDSGITAGSVVTAASAYSASGNLVQAAGANKTTSDSGVAAANVVTAASNFLGNLVQGANSSKAASDSGVAAANVVTAASNYTNGDVVQAAGANKTTSDSGVAAANLVTAASNFSGNLVQGTNGAKTTSDSGVVTANVVTAASAYSASGDLVQAAGNNKTTSDSGVVAANVVTAASNYTNGDVVQAAGANKTTSDSGVAAANLVTAASAYTASGDLVQAAGANKTTSDSGVVAANVVTAASNFSGNLVQGGSSNKTSSDSGVAAANVVTAASAYSASGDLVQSAGANKTTSDSLIQASNVSQQHQNHNPSTFGPTTGAIQYDIDGSTYSTLQAAVNAIIAVGAGTGSYINDQFPEDVTYDIFQDPNHTSAPGVDIKFGVDKAGHSISTSSPTVWTIEVPQILASGDLVSGQGIVNMGTGLTTLGDTSGGTLWISGPNHPSALTWNSSWGNTGVQTSNSGNPWYVNCANSGGHITSSQNIDVAIVQMNNLQGTYTTPHPVAGKTTGSNIINCNFSTGSPSSNAVTVANATALTQQNPNTPNSSAWTAKDFAVCAGPHGSGHLVCGCVSNATAPCTNQVVFCGTNGTVDPQGGCSIAGGTATLEYVPSLPRSSATIAGGQANSGAFAVPLHDSTNALVVLGDGNSGTGSGTDNSFDIQIGNMTIAASGAWSGSPPTSWGGNTNTPAINTPAVLIYDREAEEASWVWNVNYAGPAYCADFLVTRGNSLFSGLDPASPTLAPTQPTGVSCNYYQFLADGYDYNQNSNINIIASSFNSNLNNVGTATANMYARGDTWLHCDDCHFENGGSTGGDNVQVAWNGHADVNGVGYSKSNAANADLHLMSDGASLKAYNFAAQSGGTPVVKDDVAGFILDPGINGIPVNYPEDAFKGVLLQNDTSTGTTVNTLTKLNGSNPEAGVIAATTDKSGIIGICENEYSYIGAGKTGSCYVAFEGTAPCLFDGTTVAGDWVQISSTTGGDCHDTGSSAHPLSGQIIGRVLSTNGTGGVYNVLLSGQDSRGISLDLVGPSAAPTSTSTETAGNYYIYNGGETTAGIAPISLVNNNSNAGNTATYGAVVASLGTGTGQVGLLASVPSGAGDIFDADVSCTPSSGVWGSCLNRFKVANGGAVTASGSITATANPITGGASGAAIGFVDKSACSQSADMTPGSSSSGTTITGCTWSTVNLKGYKLDCDIPTVLASSATVAFQLANSNGAPTSGNISMWGLIGTSAAWTEQDTFAATTWAGMKTPTSVNFGASEELIHLRAVWTNNGSAGGTSNVSLQYVGNNANNVTIKANQECTLTQLN